MFFEISNTILKLNMSNFSGKNNNMYNFHTITKYVRLFLFVLFIGFLAVPNYSCRSQKETKSQKETRIRIKKEAKKDKKEYNKAIKRHKKIQTKDTQKRMKKGKKSSLGQTPKRKKGFFARFFSKKEKCTAK